jgi:Na+-driven multidrug efflux pump
VSSKAVSEVRRYASRARRPGSHGPDSHRRGRAPAVGCEPSAGRVLRFALPVVAGSLLAMGSQFAVVAVLGHLRGPALYIRSVYAPLAFLFLSLTTGLSVVAQVGSSRRRGRSDVADVTDCLRGVARIGVTSCLGLGVLLLVLVAPVGQVLSVPEDQRGLFFRFVAAMAVVAPLGLVAEVSTGAVRGAGLPGWALLLTSASVVLMITGVVVLGVVGGAGLWAVPIASALGGAVELALGLALLRRRGMLRRPRDAEPGPDVWPLVRAVGIPVGVSYVLLFVVNLLQLMIVKPYGPDAVAGFTLGYTLQSLVIVPAFGFGSAVAVLVNQHASGGRYHQARLALRNGSLIVIAGYTLITALVLTMGDQLVRHVTDNLSVVREAAAFVGTVGPAFGFTAFGLYLLTLLEHTGRGVVAMVSNLLYFACLLCGGAWLTAHRHSTDGLYQVMAVGTAAGVLVGAPVAAFFLFRRPLPTARTGETPLP